ncbi:hypothetical protein MAMC_01000 [Methylacidimicrobium cyclopophantes]|uniref:Uncharacterized protein n=1 Tax=Methylacidimicrobium cyclopophantes TaxID=1041766 RepID=A0A5E6MJI3_9BACT|nr:hypothetical protein [Methylacidimicrobium cyclopophantes]VVM06227.1 hypothetical protein MAMC_01000 [Methylacidimicrobium cyclopophantes]
MFEQIQNPTAGVNQQNLQIVGLIFLALISGVLTVNGDRLFFASTVSGGSELWLAFPVAVAYLLAGSRSAADLAVFCFYTVIFSVGLLGITHLYARYIGTPRRIRAMVEEGEYQAELKQRYTEAIRAKKGQ